MNIFNNYRFYSTSFYPRQQRVSGFTVDQQSNHYLDKNKRLFLSKQLVKSAAFHMVRNLRHYQQVNDNIKEVIEVINKYLEQMNTLKEINEVMGMEGIIRQLYYSIFNYFLNDSFAFDARHKRPHRLPLHDLISFGVR